VLYAIDGQPDGSITRKRYWEGNFLFNADPALGGSGFKAFRPTVVEAQAGARRTATRTDESLRKDPDYADVSHAQGELDATGFYDLMDELVNPGVQDPSVRLRETVVALAEAVRVRVTSIENAEAYLRARPGTTIPMPSGYEIFETTGPWEDYATPNRDLRLLVAFDAVLGWEDRVTRDPTRFGVTADGVAALRAALVERRDRWLADPELGFVYRRSDGTPQALTLSELARRLPALEVGYDPNDCPEIRFGALPGSAEAATCGRRAPEAHQAKIAEYRAWFHERRRPARGDTSPLPPRPVR
jgi:hypothetical protein